MRGGQRDVDVARFLDRFAAVQRLRDGQITRFLLNQSRDPENVLCAFRGGNPAPDFLIRAACFLDGAVDVVRIRLRDLGKLIFRGRNERLETLLRIRLDEPLQVHPAVLVQVRDLVVGHLAAGRRQLHQTKFPEVRKA